MKKVNSLSLNIFAVQKPCLQAENFILIILWNGKK